MCSPYVRCALPLWQVPTGPPVNNSWGYCTSAPGVPEQINVQIGGEPTSVVLSFVTFEVSPPVGPSLARMGTVNGSFTDQHHGITTTHVTSAGMVDVSTYEACLVERCPL